MRARGHALKGWWKRMGAVGGKSGQEEKVCKE